MSLPFDKRVVDFAVSQGFRLAHADQTAEELVSSYQKKFGCSQSQAVAILQQTLMDEVEEFFTQQMGARK